MKNFTLLFSTLLLTAFSWQANAQGDNCAAALDVTPGTYTADGPATGAGSVNSTNADWYSYTPVASGTIDISACSGPDTRLYVYDGTCAALVQIAYNDDACGLGSEILGIPVLSGTTYYFEFDDSWSTASFDWTLTFSAAATPGDCSSSGTYDYVSNSTMASSLQGFVANTPGDYITLNFSAGSTETGWDYWFINDAADGSGTTIATGDGPITGAYESTTGEISFYVESDGNTEGSTFVYSLSCSPPPSCPAPSALTASNITSSSADLGWTENGTATSWEVEWGTSAFTPGTGTAVITGTNPHALTGLTANSSYDFYVRAICGLGDTSAWAGPISFTTLCPAAYSPAYLENFTSFVPGCWDEASDGTPLTGPTGAGFGEWNHSDYLNNGGVNDAVKINLYNTGTSDWLLSPNFDMSAGGPWELVINAGVTTYNGTGSIAMGSDDSVQVVISTDGGLTWGAIYTWDVNNTPSNTGEPYAIDLAAYTGAANLFGIWASEGVVDDSEDYDFHINDFEIRVPPLCAEPSALTASNITTVSADLGWTENGTATSWEVEYDSTGFVQGTGTTVVTGTNPHALTGLTANYSYDFYVRAICGVGDTSVWTGPYSFTTPCSVYTPQYLESFNTWVSPCWDQADAGSPTTTATTFGSSNWNSTGFLNDGSGAGGVKINLYTTGTEDWMVSPTFDLSAGGPWELKIEAGVTGWNNTSAAQMGSDDMVQVVVSTDGGATWSVLHTWDATNQPSVNGEFLQLDLSAYTGTSNIFAIWAYDGTVNDPEDFDFHIGSFEIKEAAADDLAMLNVTTSASTGCSLSNSETVTIQFKNTGISSQSNFDVGYSVNGAAITPETIAGPIAAGDTITYTFTALVDMSIPMVYDIEAYTALATDVDLSNDSMSVSVNHIAPSLTFNDSLLISDGLSNGTHGIICTNGLLPNELTNCYKLSAVVIDSLVHTWDSDLTIYLITPNGDSIQLSSGNGGSGDDYIGVVFTDTAATSITTGTAGFGAGGYYSIQDVNGLGSYIGFDPNGTWDLWITDGAAGDNGTLFAWHLEFQDYSFVVDLGADASLCSGQDSLVLDAGAGAYTYLWSNMESTQTTVVSDSTVGTVDYAVIVTDSISMCEASDTVSVTFDDCSGVSELSGGTVSVYPNPSNGNFIVSLSNISEHVSVQVVDMQGRLIYSQIEGLKVGKENTISLDNVERGVYLISVSSNKGRYTQSIVIE